MNEQDNAAGPGNARESLAAVLAEMRDERIICIGNADVTRCLLRNLADRIEAAVGREHGKWERERREYEKLHNCFWENNAIQGIVRRMLDARDDLRDHYPEEADDLNYYAHELIKAANCDARGSGKTPIMAKRTER